MTGKVTDIKSKDIDNIYDPAKGCVNNAPHSKGATRSGLPGTKGAFSKHTLADDTDSNVVKN